MPQLFANSLSEIEASIRRDEEEKRKSSTLAGLTDIVKEFDVKTRQAKKERKEFEKEKQATSKDFFNTFSKLRESGVEKNLAAQKAREMTGYQGDDFVSPGLESRFEEAQKIAREKAQLGLEASRVGIEAKKADIGKAQAEQKKILAELGAGGEAGLVQTLRAVNPSTATLKQIAEIKQKFPTKTKLIENYFDVTGAKRRINIGEEYGLDAIELSEVNKLASDMFKNKIKTEKGYDNFVRPLLERRSKGETIDQIEDDLRKKGQSPEFQGALRDALQQIVPMNISSERFNEMEDRLGDLSYGKEPGKVLDYLKKQARGAATTTERSQIMAQERLNEFLGEIKGELQAYEDGGGDTNVFTGTTEQALNKIGLTKEPELKKIATRIQAAIQRYRLGVSGKAFNILESEEYNEMFPDMKSVNTLNMAKLEGLSKTIGGDIDFFYRAMMGEDAYETLYKKPLEEIGEEEPEAPEAPEGQGTSERVMINKETEKKMLVEVDSNNNVVRIIREL
jgi:hypothetical protein